MGIVPRVRQARSRMHLLFVTGGAIVGSLAGATAHLGYGLGMEALAIAACVGFGVAITAEAVFTVMAVLLGWPQLTRMSPGEALEGLLVGLLRL